MFLTIMVEYSTLIFITITRILFFLIIPRRPLPVNKKPPGDSRRKGSDISYLIPMFFYLTIYTFRILPRSTLRNPVILISNLSFS